MKNYKYAFTMLELVFVIVVIGILSAIAIPKFSETRTDAQITKGRADISSIRSAIITERQSRLIKGDSKYIAAGTGAKQLDDNTTTTGLFGGVLTYPISDSTSDGHWHNTGHPDVNSSTYSFKAGATSATFTYTRSNGKFTCSTTAGTAKQIQLCKDLIN